MARRLLGKILREEIAMRKVRLLSALLPLVLVIACSDDNSTVAPPPPPSLSAEDQQIVTACQTMRDKLEVYAAAHNGTYGDYYIAWNEAGLQHVDNPYTGETEPSGIRAAAPGQIGLEAYVCDGTALGYRITGYGKDHMLITLESLGNVPADVLSNHDISVANAFLVRETALLFAATNDGVFSTDVAGDTNKDGKTLKDLLPNGELLLNPFESVYSEPEDGVGLGWHGAVGYLGADSGSGYIDAFTIESYSCDGDVMVTLTRFLAYHEEIVNWQASELRFAVEQFKHDSGHYPHNLDVEMTPAGKTVINLYTDFEYHHYTDFLNPYTKQHYIPALGIATGKGEVAYQPMETSGEVTDYVVTGRNAFDEFVRLGKNPLN